MVNLVVSTASLTSNFEAFERRARLLRSAIAARRCGWRISSFAPSLLGLVKFDWATKPLLAIDEQHKSHHHFVIPKMISA